MRPAPFLESARVHLRLLVPGDADAMLAYYLENRAHLEPFEPSRPAEFYTRDFWVAQVERNAREFLADSSMRLALFRNDAPHKVVGNLSFTAITRGVSHCANMGYGLAGEVVGRGYFTEILPVALRYAFAQLNLHRVQANYMPRNERSGALLRRLGFVVEGYARDYLHLHGSWEDHILTSLTSTCWCDPQAAGRSGP